MSWYYVGTTNKCRVTIEMGIPTNFLGVKKKQDLKMILMEK
jgi:hypothetical protein